MRCDETDMTWLGQMTDFTDVYATVSGNEFLITEEGYSGKNTHLVTTGCWDLMPHI